VFYQMSHIGLQQLHHNFCEIFPCVKHCIMDRSTTFFRSWCSSSTSVGKMRLLSLLVTRNPGSFLANYQLHCVLESEAEHILCNYAVSLQDLRENCHAYFL